MYQVLGRTDSEEQWIELPLTDEDRAKGIDAKLKLIDENGEEWIFECIGNHDPDAPTLEEIVADMLVNHYEVAKMFGFCVPALEKRLNE
jgi:hypothetical protein